MLYEHMDKLEAIGLDLFCAALFFCIGMAIKEVLQKGDIPPFGKKMVWLVLFLGCTGFLTKGLIQLTWHNTI